MKPSLIRDTLADLDMTPSKPLGQNFLHDTQLAAWIVRQLDLQPHDHLIEIGPGLGALTEHALPLVHRATLIEKDSRLVEHLRHRFQNHPNLTIIHGDAAHTDLRPFLPLGPAKILGNLPYYVSSQILFQFTARPTPAVAMVFMLQKEMAHRIAAAPATEDYGAPTVLIALDWHVRHLRHVPPQVFIPEPKVESSIIRLDLRPPHTRPICDPHHFRALVHAGFAQRRKQLRKMLAPHLAPPPQPGHTPAPPLDWPRIAAQLGIPDTARAEELDLTHWTRLAQIIPAPSDPHPASDTAQTHAQRPDEEIFDTVDEHDNPIGHATRRQTHAQNLRHRAVHILVLNQTGELLLQKRSHLKDNHPGLWDSSAAGHVEAGQTYDATAHRELHEELGLTPLPGHPLQPLGKLPATADTGWEFIQAYLLRHNGPVHPNPAEVETTAFLPIPLLADWITQRPQDFAPGIRLILPLLLQHQNPDPVPIEN